MIHEIPIANLIIKEIKKYGFDPDHTLKSVKANKHNPATATYYLLLKKLLKEGNKSPADLSSNHFEPITIESWILNNKVLDFSHIPVANKKQEENLEQ